MIGDSAGDGLPDPPCSIGREPVAQSRIEPLDGFNETRVALLDEVLEEHSTPTVLLGDGDHKPQVLLDEALSGLLVAFPRPPTEIPFLGGGEQPAAPDFSQVLCKGVLRHPVPFRLLLVTSYAAG